MSRTQYRLKRRSDYQDMLWSLMAAVKDPAVILLDTAGHVLSWNSGAESLFGYSADEIVGRHVSVCHTADDIARGNPSRQLSVAATTGHCEVIGERVRKDRSRFAAKVAIKPVLGPDGVLCGYGKIIQGLDEDRALAEVDANEGRWQNLIDTVLDTVVDGLIIIDRDGVIQCYNRGSARLFGYTPEEALGQPVTILMPEPHRSQHPDYVRSYRTTGLPKIIGVSRDVVGRRKDGSNFPIALTVGESKHADHHVFVGVVRDLTERREADRAREQLRQAQKMEAVGQLTGGLAHDFNNLLAIIIGNLDNLHDLRRDDPVSDELVNAALDAALRGADLTQRLLAFARRQPLKPERADINDIIGGIMKLLARTLGENITIQLALGGVVWPVLIDRGQFEAVIANLATNARDAMPKGGSLLISTHNGRLDDANLELHAEADSGDYVVVEVSDSGCGMPPEILNRVFEPFFTTKELGKGTGLGLSMVFGFMKQSGGHISVYSDVGKGTTFRLYLPRQGDSIAEQPVGPAQEASLGGDETILVVEDNESLRRLVVRQLSDAGYRVLQAGEADTAMSVIAGAEPIDLLLTDIVMPGEMDGRDLARAARLVRPRLKVLLTSGYPDARFFSALAPGSRLLSKPYRGDDLRRAVREAIDVWGPAEATMRP